MEPIHTPIMGKAREKAKPNSLNSRFSERDACVNFNCVICQISQLVSLERATKEFLASKSNFIIVCSVPSYISVDIEVECFA